MFKRKAKKAEEVKPPQRVRLFGYAGPHQSWSCDEVRSMDASLTSRFSEKLSAVIEYEDELWAILENSPDFHRLHRVRLQQKLDAKLNESSAISQEIINLSKTVQS